MNICDGQYPETIIVEYSSTGNEPSDFTGLKGGYICPDQHGWLKYTFTLPEDARYFALHHVGDDGDAQFGLMIDDLSFTPLEGAPVVEGYNLYRDGELLIGGLTTPGYVDNTVDLSAPVMYTVKTLSTVNGEKIESDRSNVIWAGEGSAVDNIISHATAVRGGKNYISIAGLRQGAEYFVADTNGRIITSGESSGKLIVINATPGVYVVTAGNEKAKVIVR